VTDLKVRGLPESLYWLADAPLFSDAAQIEKFYDAVASPEGKEGKIALQIDEQTITTLKGKGDLEASVTTEKFAALLVPLFAFFKPEIKASVEAEAGKQTTQGKAVTLEMEPISTPQRQLKQLALYYLVNQPTRIFFVDDPNTPGWRDAKSVAKVPRSLVFLSLPSPVEADEKKLPRTRLIPTAAEFENGKIVQIYRKLGFTDQDPPEYPERGTSEEDLRTKRKAYWKWFDENYSATKAMVAVEEAASENGRIHWIDYRLPITADGDTLHLHVCPGGLFDTGVLAYNFIKRGFKHGIRLVGTLKSEPDMNILAVYDR
jgi:hypothetical protein